MDRSYAKRKYQNNILPVIYGVLTTLLICIICAAVIALLTAKEQVNISSLKYVVPVIQLISSFTGVSVAQGLITTNKIMTGSISAVSSYLVLLAVNLLLFQGEFSSAGVGFLAVVIGWGVAVLLNRRKERGSLVKKRYSHSR